MALEKICAWPPTPWAAWIIKSMPLEGLVAPHHHGGGVCCMFVLCVAVFLVIVTHHM